MWQILHDLAIQMKTYPMPHRAVIYARYSSDNQREASIDDQVRICRELIARNGWEVAQVFCDQAISGSTSLRRGYQALLEGAREGAFDFVVAEALDRLSRDQEDVAGLYKRMRYAGVQIVTVADGEINELHVGLKGTMNALFLKDLAQRPIAACVAVWKPDVRQAASRMVTGHRAE